MKWMIGMRVEQVHSYMSYWYYQSCWLGDSNISHGYWSIQRYSTALKVMTDEAFLMNCQKDHEPLSCFCFCHQELACFPFFFLLLMPFECSSSEISITKDCIKSSSLLAWCQAKIIWNFSKKINVSIFLLEV